MLKSRLRAENRELEEGLVEAVGEIVRLRRIMAGVRRDLRDDDYTPEGRVLRAGFILDEVLAENQGVESARAVKRPRQTHRPEVEG